MRPFVKHRFELSDRIEDRLRSLIPPFGYNGFGELVFYRTYSRTKWDGGQEDWADVIIRVTNGTFSIRKDWYLKNGITWDEEYWQKYAAKFSRAMFMMEWMPPGRGLWAMGSDFVYDRGSMALYNCAYTDITTRELSDDIGWLMDSLMHGVGVGFGPTRDDALTIHNPVGEYDHIIPDTREGWVDSEMALIDAYMKPGQKKPRFIYDNIRPEGVPIKGFGGIASGPKPLKELHEYTIAEFERYQTRPEYDSVYLKANLANRVGCCVVAGNVRRSAELAKGKITDQTFVNLKDYKKFPEREAFGWMSNNSVELQSDEDFMMLGEIARRVVKNGEPGYINRRNMPYGRIGKKMGSLRRDKAVGFNPCGEIPLEHREVCNISETLPTMCRDVSAWYNACEYATVYMTSVSLLPTHQPKTNRVVARNRRIGASIVDYTGWILKEGVHKVTKYMRDGYKVVRKTARWMNEEAGVPLPIRHTTVKPGGTGPKLPGRTSGVGFPTFDYTIRRIRVAKNSPVHPILANAGIPYENDRFDKYTDVFEYPILQGPAKPASQATIWEQAFNLITMQREWADNAVSNTLYFKPEWPLIEHVEEDFAEKVIHYFGVAAWAQIKASKLKEYLAPEMYRLRIKWKDDSIVEMHVYQHDPTHEEKDVEPVLSATAPLTKSLSVLPHSDKGAYKQMPEEGISKNEYERRLAEISKIDWTTLSGSDGIDERYCTGPVCELPQPGVLTS